MARTDLQGTTWLVTGANRGIGRAFALSLAGRGARLALSARQEGALAEAAEACRAAGADVTTYPVNLLDPAGPAVLMDAVRRDAGAPDGLVNNAGFSFSADVLKTPEDELYGQLEVNVLAVMKLTRNAAPTMVERGRGWILNVSSMAGFQPVPTQAVYGAAKAWVLSFSNALHHELADAGVHVTALCPGLTRTEFFERARVDMQSRFVRLGSWSTPEDVARIGLDAVLRNKMVVVPGFMNRVVSGLQRLLPRGVVARATARVMR